MEGPERTAKRREEEQERVLKGEMAVLDKRLSEITKEKEKLELKWVELDDKRTEIKKVLDPIKDKEKTVEAEELVLEEEEARQPFPKEKHTTEDKRWAVQEKRHQIEGEKWPLEQKILALDEQVAANTATYQKFLDEETELKNKRHTLKKELPAEAKPDGEQT